VYWGRVISELDNPDFRRYTTQSRGILCWRPSMMSKVHAAHPEAEMYFTEGSTDYNDPHYQDDWTKWSRLIPTCSTMDRRFMPHGNIGLVRGRICTHQPHIAGIVIAAPVLAAGAFSANDRIRERDRSMSSCATQWPCSG